MDPADLKAARPVLQPAEAAHVAASGFGFEGSATELPSDRDRNFLLTSADGTRAVLKVARFGEDPEDLVFENSIMASGVAAGLPLPETVGPPLYEVEVEDGRKHQTRLITCLPGRPLAEVCPAKLPLLREFGEILGRLDNCLAEIPGGERVLHWDLRQADGSAEGAVHAINPKHATLFKRWRERLAPTVAALPGLPEQLIHGDANDYNVLVTEKIGTQQITGLLDFGDSLVSARVAEPAIALAYAMLDRRAPLRAAAALLEGYTGVLPLEDEELAVVFELAALRLVQSVANSALRKLAEPENTYLTVSEAPAWRALTSWIDLPPALAAATVRVAAGRPALAKPARAVTLGKLMELDPADVQPLDLSIPTAAQSSSQEWIAAALGRGGVPVTRFGELSEVGATSEPGEDWEEVCSRRLGLELYRSGEVRAPWTGTLEASGCRALLRAPEHPVLLLEGLTGARTGPVTTGALIGTVSTSLHVQLVGDDLGLGMDLPTRSRADDALWRELALDPGPALGLTGCTAEDFTPPLERHRGRALSLSYSTPLTILRGTGTTLIDAAGRQYLDAVNNVPHVGHGHPRVVRALAEQAALLNTNTRYLHPVRDRYQARLAALFDDPLEMVYLVNSGSEANELALRLVEEATGGTDWVVVAAGYHGNTRRLVERSHYKFAGSGGFCPPDSVHVVPLPDTYRGQHRGDDAAELYAAYVADACTRIHAAGRRVAGFLAEPLIGCGGQVVPPEGWLARCYEHVHAAGGLCVADEIQVGFGRVGTHWWAFAEQGATPDLVTLGKPIGNGHPLGAVITSRGIAEEFDGGMEWFNTFGGNPVSCAVGMAVLDVIEGERLLDNARTVGGHLTAGLEDLASASPLIGEVRGRGLYLGVEIVEDRSTRAPAGAIASYIAERMHARGVLISTDGPSHNVLKIKPPIAFSMADADRLLETLAAVLAETAVTPPASP